MQIVLNHKSYILNQMYKHSQTSPKIQGHDYQHLNGDTFIVVNHRPQYLILYHISKGPGRMIKLTGQRITDFINEIPKMKLISQGHFTQFKKCYDPIYD